MHLHQHSIALQSLGTHPTHLRVRPGYPQSTSLQLYFPRTLEPPAGLGWIALTSLDHHLALFPGTPKTRQIAPRVLHACPPSCLNLACVPFHRQLNLVRFHPVPYQLMVIVY